LLHDYVSNLSLENIQLSLNVESNGSFLHVGGISLNLDKEKLQHHSTHNMPGLHGPLPQLSSGIFPIQVMQSGSFIDSHGTQSVTLQDVVWELCWSDGAPSGSFICAFTVPRNYIRNDAQLLAGTRYYTTFSIFSHQGLEELQLDKANMMNEIQELVQLRQDAAQRMRSTMNPIVKATEYAKAVDALERLSYYDTDRLNLIPSNQDVVPVSDSLFISKKGELWSRDGQMSGKGTKRILHGTIWVRPKDSPPLAP
jgi:hypothetical protein